MPHRSHPPHHPPPLAAFGGAVPDAPAWFQAAIADLPERSTVTVQGAPIETLAWGRAGDPGLLLLHGNGAHADWFSFIAPQLKAGRRVWTANAATARRTCGRPGSTAARPRP